MLFENCVLILKLKVIFILTEKRVICSTLPPKLSAKGCCISHLFSVRDWGMNENHRPQRKQVQDLTNRGFPDGRSAKQMTVFGFSACYFTLAVVVVRATNRLLRTGRKQNLVCLSFSCAEPCRIDCDDATSLSLLRCQCKIARIALHLINT